MIGSSVRWPTWVTDYPVRRWEHSAPPRHCSGSEAKPDHLVEGLYSAHMNVLTGADFFTVEVLSRRGLVTYYVLFFIHLDTRSQCGGDHQTFGSRTDATDRPQRNAGELGISEWMPLRFARSRHEVLRIISACAGGSWRQGDSSSSQKSESERLCGTLSSVRKGRMSIKVDSVR
jgi:hypothetical protein